jgi:8-amino-7-oxononanoate synthase
VIGGNALRRLEADLDALGAAGLLRAEEVRPSSLLDLCSNDYLGYASEPWPGVTGESGAGASRLVTGNREAHKAAEAALASWLGGEEALLFSSGYAANVGLLSALARPGDVIVSDALNHASIIDGCRLAGAAIRVVPHGDVDAVGDALRGSAGAASRWVVTESYFSMEGDSPDLAAMRTLCDRHDGALIVDEAHALGVFGPRGSGRCAAAGIRPDVLVGTAGKALGLQGAFVVGSSSLRRWLWNRARSFVFSTGISPELARAIEARVARVAADDPARAKLLTNAKRLRDVLQGLGIRVAGDAAGPILPWVVGANEDAVRLARRLRENGILIHPIRPPTVPPGTSRLRVTASARLGEGELSLAERAFRAAMHPDA